MIMMAVWVEMCNNEGLGARVAAAAAWVAVGARFREHKRSQYWAQQCISDLLHRYNNYMHYYMNVWMHFGLCNVSCNAMQYILCNLVAQNVWYVIQCFWNHQKSQSLRSQYFGHQQLKLCGQTSTCFLGAFLHWSLWAHLYWHTHCDGGTFSKLTSFRSFKYSSIGACEHKHSK